MPPRRANADRAAAKKARISYAKSGDGDDDTDSYAESDPIGHDARAASSPDSGSDFLQSSTSLESDEEIPSNDQCATHSPRSSAPNRAKVNVKAKAMATAAEIKSVTKLTAAPKQRHQPGKIARPVVDFLAKLADPRYNNRDWFRANDCVWRWVKEDWEAFVGHYLQDIIDKVDETVPYLPFKDLVYRIHRDIRFSNDKTPYKKTLMATFSRGGRKGPFAGYHLCIRANGESALHAGLWEPPAEILATLRRNIDEKTREFVRFNDVITDKAFGECFGSSKPNLSKGVKGSLWGRDELKSAPKGFDKTHPRIHLLRLKSFCVSHYLSDDEVVQHDFKEKLIKTARLAKPFVEALNEMIHPSPPPPPGVLAARERQRG